MELDRCSDLASLLPAYALGEVDERLSMRVQLHLAEGCVSCARRLEELVVRFHIAALPEQPTTLSASFAERVLTAAAGVQQERPEPLIVYPQPPERGLLWTLVALSLLTVAAVAFWGHRQQAALGEALARASFMERAALRSVDELGALQSIVRRVTDPRLRVGDARGEGEDFSAVRARALFDATSSELWLRVLGLPPMAPHQGYVLWQVWTEGESQLVGVLLPQLIAQGGTSHFDLPASEQDSVSIVLTRQPLSSLDGGPAGVEVLMIAASSSAPSPSPSAAGDP